MYPVPFFKTDVILIFSVFFSLPTCGKVDSKESKDLVSRISLVQLVDMTRGGLPVPNYSGQTYHLTNITIRKFVTNLADTEYLYMKIYMSY